MMLPLKVRRSTMAAQILGLVKVFVQPLKFSTPGDRLMLLTSQALTG